MRDPYFLWFLLWFSLVLTTPIGKNVYRCKKKWGRGHLGSLPGIQHKIWHGLRIIKAPSLSNWAAKKVSSVGLPQFRQAPGVLPTPDRSPTTTDNAPTAAPTSFNGQPGCGPVGPQQKN
jgi:hypothetical protein